MKLPELIRGRLLRRYKRFLADVQLDSGEVITASVANTGAMTGLIEQGAEVYLTSRAAPGNKTTFRWLLVDTREQSGAGRSNLVCVDTSIATRLVNEALEAGKLEPLAGYRERVQEMPLGDNSRADFCLRVHESDMLGRCWVEVKSVTMKSGQAGAFPDAVTSRGRKHLDALRARAEAGERAVQLFVLMRGDCKYVRPAVEVDPQYSQALVQAKRAGVELLGYMVRISKHEIRLERQVEVVL